MRTDFLLNIYTLILCFILTDLLSSMALYYDHEPCSAVVLLLLMSPLLLHVSNKATFLCYFPTSFTVSTFCNI